jgi:cytochrome c oxidase assembly factor 1
MLPRSCLRPIAVRQLLQIPVKASRRNLVAAPGPNSGPLMERRADRALPALQTRNVWLRTAPIFGVIVVLSTLAIFNYQKSASSVVTSTMYALRTNEEARSVLGDEVYFAHSIPWIWGSIDQVHGKIDIQFLVKGTKTRGTMRFKSERRKRMGYVSTGQAG